MSPPTLPVGEEPVGVNLALLPNFITWFLLALLLIVLWQLLDREKRK